MKPSAILVISAALCLSFVTVQACENDQDCGVGGTCIKREKRARGVCYGGEPAPQNPTTTMTPDYIDPLSMPSERPEGACFVTEECPAGTECVKAGVWGNCQAVY